MEIVCSPNTTSFADIAGTERALEILFRAGDRSRRECVGAETE